MKNFAALIAALDRTTKTNEKLRALISYLDVAPDSDKLWCIALLSGRRPKRPVKTSWLRQWAAEEAGIPLWLFEESYFVVGDLAETVALVLPPPSAPAQRSLSEYMLLLQGLKALEESAVAQAIKATWAELAPMERFVFNKLITGGFRIGVSQKLMVRALAAHLQLEENLLAHRMMGQWKPESTTFQKLLLEPDEQEELSRPYPFYLAYPLETEPENLGPVYNWLVEYKWDGIRGQLIHRKAQAFIWSRGEELVTHQFPELEALALQLPDGTVLDGEIVAHADGEVLPFNQLQQRLGRKVVGKALLKKAPVKLIAYDLLELEGRDLRGLTQEERRAALAPLVASAEHPSLLLSPELRPDSWSSVQRLRQDSRSQRAEGLMLKRRTAAYKVGRKKGDWWKWKIDPLSIDAVLIYAQRGHGRRANLYTDYTFAVWDGHSLVPFTKAYSGLTDAELRQVDHFVKRNTIERFGPVRSVKPELVMEIGFEGIAASSRHKSGIALRFPRILRWRTDKPAAEANSLPDLQSLLKKYA